MRVLNKRIKNNQTKDPCSYGLPQCTVIYFDGYYSKLEWKERNGKLKTDSKIYRFFFIDSNVFQFELPSKNIPVKKGSFQFTDNANADARFVSLRSWFDAKTDNKSIALVNYLLWKWNSEAVFSNLFYLKEGITRRKAETDLLEELKE